MRDPLFLPHVEAVSSGLRALGVRPGERVLVSGAGLIAELAAEALAHAAGLSPLRVIPGANKGTHESREASEVDVLIDTSGDATWWTRIMAQVRRQGRVLLLIPPGPQVHPFDFYINIHRGSLTLLVRRVPA